MRIAVAGKGGSGKTTVAGSLARILARKGVKNLLAIDGDSNPNLAITLGLHTTEFGSLDPLPRGVLKKVQDERGNPRSVLAFPPDEIIRRHSIATPDGVALLLMSRVDHAGAG